MTNAGGKVECLGLKKFQAYVALKCGHGSKCFGQSLVSPWDGPVNSLASESRLAACNRIRTVTVRKEGRG